MIHVIEHMKNARESIDALTSLASPGTLAYIEWPSPETVRWPRARDVRERLDDIQERHGLTTLNYFDDTTHVGNAPPSADEVMETLKEAGFRTISAGRVELGQVADDLASWALRNNDQTSLLLALWARFGFAQYVLACFARETSGE